MSKQQANTGACPTECSESKKTLALGVYPAVSLAQARKTRDAARELMAQGIDPSSAKQDAVHEKKLSAASTYELVAREFHKLKAESWSEAHCQKWIRMNELYLFPLLGNLAIKDIKASKVLVVLRKVETKGILSTAQDLQQMLGQVFRYAVQTDRIEQSPISDLKGALKSHVPKHSLTLSILKTAYALFHWLMILITNLRSTMKFVALITTPSNARTSLTVT
jgi:hypothetical protein